MPRKRARILPQALRDLNEETIYLAKAADTEIAVRFYDAAQDTFRSLLQMPGMGRQCFLKNARLRDIRQWSVAGFDKYLIFYRVVPSGINIVRILHGARDVRHVLENETPTDG